MASASLPVSAQENATSTTSSGRAWLTFAVVFLLYMLNYMDRQVMAAVAIPLKNAMGFTDSEIGMLQTVFLLCVAGFALPSAFLLDRWSRPKGIALMAIFWSAATAFTGMATSLGLLIVARAFVGIGEAGYSSGGTAMLSTAFPEKSRAKVLGLFNASIPLGAALGTVLGGMLAADGNWKRPFFVFAVPGVLLAFAALSLRDGRPASTAAVATPAPAFGPALKKLLSIRTLRFTYLAFGMNLFMQSALLQWGPAYFANVFGLDNADATKKSSIMMVLALVGSPLGGFLADKWTAKNPSGRALSSALTSLLAALALTAGLLLREKGYPFMLLWGVLTVCYLAPAGAITQDVVSPKLRATAWGACVLSMYLLGGAYSPVIVGKISDATGDMGRALLIVPIGGVIASVLFFLAGRSYVADKAAAEAETAQEEATAAAA